MNWLYNEEALYTLCTQKQIVYFYSLYKTRQFLTHTLINSVQKLYTYNQQQQNHVHIKNHNALLTYIVHMHCMNTIHFV